MAHVLYALKGVKWLGRDGEAPFNSHGHVFVEVAMRLFLSLGKDGIWSFTMQSSLHK